MHKAKFTQIEYAKEAWTKGPFPMYYHKATLDDGYFGQITTKDEKPSWLEVGSEITYERLNDKNGNPKIKRVNPQFSEQPSSERSTSEKKTYGKPMLLYVDAVRMSRSNAVHAVFTVNANNGSEVLRGADLESIVNFTLGEITADTPKFDGGEDSLFASRLATVNNVAIKTAYDKEINDVDSFLTEVKKVYAWVVR